MRWYWGVHVFSFFSVLWMCEIVCRMGWRRKFGGKEQPMKVCLHGCHGRRSVQSTFQGEPTDSREHRLYGLAGRGVAWHVHGITSTVVRSNVLIVWSSSFDSSILRQFSVRISELAVAKQWYFSFKIHFRFSFYKFFSQSFLFLYYISIYLNDYFSFYKFLYQSFLFYNISVLPETIIPVLYSFD